MPKSKKSIQNAKTAKSEKTANNLASIKNMIASVPNNAFASLEAAEDAVVIAQAPVVQAAQASDKRDFKVILGDLNPDAVQAQVKVIAGELAARKTLEMIKNCTNGNIQRTLKNAEKNLVRNHAAAVMIAASVDAKFINRSLKDGEHYNVYALGKFSDLVDALTGNAMSNSINIAIVRTLFNFKKAGLAFTTEIARAAASDKIRTANIAVRKHIVSHTVSASTAPTQESSTMMALETLGIVSASGKKGNRIYAVIDTPQSRALETLATAMVA